MGELINVYPFMPGGGLQHPLPVTVALDATNEAHWGCGFWTTPDGKTRSITHICWSIATVTTGGSFLAQLDALVTTTGLASGIIATGASGVVSVSASGLVEFPLGTPYTLTSGTWMGAKIIQNGSGSITVRKVTGNYAAAQTGSWCVDAIPTAAKVTNQPNVALKCSTGEYLILPGGNAVSDYSTSSFTTSTTPRSHGTEIIAPYRARLVGAMVHNIDHDAASSTYQLRSAGGALLKGDDDTTNMSLTMYGPYRFGSAALPYQMVRFPCPKTLEPGVPYYLCFVPTVTTAFNIASTGYINTTVMKQCRQIPTGWTVARATAPSGYTPWTTTATSFGSMVPVFSHIEIPRFRTMVRSFT